MTHTCRRVVRSCVLCCRAAAVGDIRGVFSIECFRPVSSCWWPPWLCGEISLYLHHVRSRQKHLELTCFCLFIPSVISVTALYMLTLEEDVDFNSRYTSSSSSLLLCVCLLNALCVSPVSTAARSCRRSPPQKRNSRQVILHALHRCLVLLHQIMTCVHVLNMCVQRRPRLLPRPGLQTSTSQTSSTQMKSTAAIPI